MKSAIAWVVLIVLVAAAGVYGMGIHREAVDAAAYAQRLATLKRDFLEKSTGLQLVSNEQYRREVGVALSHYFRELDELGRELPGYQDVSRKRAEVETKLAAGTMDEIQKAQRDERIDFTLELFESMRVGRYRPVYTAANNTFRFDITDIRPVTLGGQPRIEVAYVHWGAFGDVTYSSIEGSFGGSTTESGGRVAIPKLLGDGQPPSLQIEPERWVSEFIPGVEIGYYDFPLMPATARDISLRFDFEVHTVGGSTIPVHITFPAIPIADAWRIGSEEQWEARKRYVTEEELRAEGAVD